jgi:hypothetical protein
VRGAGVKVELDWYAGLAEAQGVGEVFVAEHVELGCGPQAGTLLEGTLQQVPGLGVLPAGERQPRPASSRSSTRSGTDRGVGGLAAVGHRAAKAVHGRDPDRGDDSDRDESRTQTVDEGRRRGVPAGRAEHGADQ